MVIGNLGAAPQCGLARLGNPGAYVSWIPATSTPGLDYVAYMNGGINQVDPKFTVKFPLNFKVISKLPGDYTNQFAVVPVTGYLSNPGLATVVTKTSTDKCVAPITVKGFSVDALPRDVGPIPDYTGGPFVPLDSIINIEQTGTVDKIVVSVSLRHTYLQDLLIQLVAPDGVSKIDLFSHEGQTNADLGLGGTRTVFDDESVINISDINYHPPYAGSFRPEQSLGTTFHGLNFNGPWTLRIYDTATSDTGELLAWSIAILPE